MLASISLWYGSIKVDKLLETNNSEIFKIECDSGHVLHEAWISELDFERLRQIKEQLHGLAA